MNNVLQTIKLIVALLPTLMEVIKALENAFPQGGNGAAKLAALREILAGAFDVVKDLGVTFDQLWPALERVISSLVALFNKTGTFQK